MIKDIKEYNKKVYPNMDRIEEMKDLFPNCFDAAGRLNLELFQKELSYESGEDFNYAKESYELNFLGKSYAKLVAGLKTETYISPDTVHNSMRENVNSKNIYITGDNLDALKHLAKAYEGAIKCIYIDPPYNRDKDFTYSDRFGFTADDLMRRLNMSASEAQRVINMTSKKESSDSAWLTFMWPRLYLARSLLKPEGVIFISIDDSEEANLKFICDEIFGVSNFVALFPWRKRTAKSDVPHKVSQDYEYVLCYARSDKFVASVEGGTRRYYETPDFPGRPWRTHDMTKQTTAAERPNSYFTISNPKTGAEYSCDVNRTWCVTAKTFQKYYNAGRIVFPGDYDFLNISKPVMRYFKDEDMEREGEKFGRIALSTNFPKKFVMSENGTIEITEYFSRKVFEHPKPVELIKYLLEATTSDGDIVMDFFSGSATTAEAVMRLNAEDESEGCRKYILVQIDEEIKAGSEALNLGYKTIDEIGRARIKKAAEKIKTETKANIDYGFKNYFLKETPENLLDRMEEFNPVSLINDPEIYKKYGSGSILETWKLRDGMMFETPVTEIDLNGYKAFKCGACLYLINPGISVENIKDLVERYDTAAVGSDRVLDCDKVVIFGYSFSFSEIEMIRNNIKQIKNFTGDKIVVYTRY